MRGGRVSQMICPVCEQPESEGLLCKDCARKLVRDLTDLPELMRALDDVLTRQAQTGTGNGKRKSSSTPLPFDQSASITRESVVNTITTWVRELDLGDVKVRTPQCTCRVPLAPCQGYVMVPVPPNFRALCGWLCQRIVRIRMHPAVVEIYDELTYMVADVRRTVDVPGPRTFYGKCEVCERDIYGRSDAAEVVCRYCEMAGVAVVYPAASRRTGLWAAAEDHLVTSRVVMTALPVYGLPTSPATFRSWLHRGMLLPKQDPKRPGAMLYRLGDALALARKGDDATRTEAAM